MTWKCTNTPKGENKLYSDAKGVVPSLDLRFAEGKTLNDYMTGQQLIQFSRSSIGTYVDENGIIQTATADTPRFDHNPTTGESLGLLVEESRTNAIDYSETFSAPLWSNVPLGTGSNPQVTSSAEASPGLTSPTRLVCNLNGGTTSGDISYIQKTSTYTANQTGTIYLKSNTGSNQQVYFRIGATVSIVTVTPTWQRFEVKETSFSGGGNFNIGTRGGTGSDDSIDILIWGAQLEVGSFPTSYIPTTGTALTRSADVASITGSNFSSWYNQSEGTTYLDFSRPFAPVSSKYWYSFSGSNIITQRHSVYQPANLAVVATTNDGTPQATFSIAGSFSNKHVYAYKLNDYAACVDGGTVGTDTTATVPAIVKLNIGSFGNGFEQPNGTIARLTYFPERLPDSSLQTMTTP